MSTHTASKRNEHISAIQNFINTKKPFLVIYQKGFLYCYHLFIKMINDVILLLLLGME